MKSTSQRVSTASESVGAEPVGLHIAYNHDLDVSEAFLCAFPSIREALRDERLLERFNYFDQKAKDHKRSFHRLGRWSLILGMVPLVVAAVRMIVGEPLFIRVADANIAAELCGVASVCLV